MVNELKAFLNSLIKIGPQLYGLYKKGRLDGKIVELLECYYILDDLITTAEELLNIVHDKKEIVFADLSKKELEDNFMLVQTKITIQLLTLTSIR